MSSRKMYTGPKPSWTYLYYSNIDNVLTSSAIGWCDANCSGDYIFHETGTIYKLFMFENEEDAMLFRMMYGD